MAAELIVAPEVERDIAQAYDWYEVQRVGLGDDFLSRVDACIQGIVRNPELHKTIHEQYRRGLVRRFPYAVFTSTWRAWSQSIICFTRRATRRNGGGDFHNLLEAAPWHGRSRYRLAGELRIIRRVWC
jgi:hypothetical protein